VLDGDPATYWSAPGAGQWLFFDLGAPTWVNEVFITWHLGNTRSAIFGIEVSPDGLTWYRVWSGYSSGSTLLPEAYGFIEMEIRYVQLNFFGNETGAANEVAEVEISLSSGI
jgi:hypothetical protein